MYKTLLFFSGNSVLSRVVASASVPTVGIDTYDRSRMPAGSDGNYTLTADDGAIYQLTGNTSALKDHIGHELQITGMTAGSSAEISGKVSSTGATQPATVAVKTMKHISKTCKSAAK